MFEIKESDKLEQEYKNQAEFINNYIDNNL